MLSREAVTKWEAEEADLEVIYLLECYMCFLFEDWPFDIFLIIFCDTESRPAEMIDAGGESRVVISVAQVVVAIVDLAVWSVVSETVPEFVLPRQSQHWASSSRDVARVL